MSGRATTVFALAIAAVLSACGGGQWNGGIIARLAWSEVGGLRAVEVPEDGAAHAGGLRAGDRIIGIDGEPVEGRSEREVVQALRGEVGTEVVLEVSRDGETMLLRIERAPYRARGS
jgi:C-terminal processing protease CtpA/Prc